MTARDPNIKKHPPERLRWFAKRFEEMAIVHRRQADKLVEKAARYSRRADDLESGK